MSADTFPTPQGKQQITFILGSWLLLAGVFSIPLLGNAAHNLLLGLPVILLLCSRMIIQYPTLLKDNSTALICTTLFIWMAISISWSSAESNYSIKMLSKYREFLLIPLFMIYFSINSIRKKTFGVLYIALLLSLIFSYLIHFDIVNFWDNQHSIKNRIFHGISTAFFAYMSLQAMLAYKKYRFVFVLIFLTTIHNLFFIENGRTGYILICTLTILFCWQQWKIKGLLVLLGTGSAIAALVILYTDLSHLRLFNNPDANVNSEVFNLSTIQQIDIRIEYYVFSLLAFMDSWVLGHGIGGFPQAYLDQHSLIASHWEPTVNSHNEYLQISVQTGILGLILFLSFLISILCNRRNKPILQQQFQTALATTFIISCMFNSSFMDHGDGTLFMILTALISGTSWNNSGQPNEDIQPT